MNPLASVCKTISKVSKVVVDEHIWIDSPATRGGGELVFLGINDSYC